MFQVGRDQGKIMFEQPDDFIWPEYCHSQQWEVADKRTIRNNYGYVTNHHMTYYRPLCDDVTQPHVSMKLFFNIPSHTDNPLVTLSVIIHREDKHTTTYRDLTEIPFAAAIAMLIQ